MAGDVEDSERDLGRKEEVDSSDEKRVIVGSCMQGVKEIDSIRFTQINPPIYYSTW
jgi:hypothetical protein